MKYQIIIEKTTPAQYVAYCPLITDLRAYGETIDTALSSLQQIFTCYLHDPDAEMEVVMSRNDMRLDASQRMIEGQ